MLRILIAVPLLALAACNGGTSISIDGENVSIHSNMALDGADLDMNGVELYPGSTVRDFKLDARDNKDGPDKGKVAIKFDSPAALATVQSWYKDALGKQGYTVTAKGNGFSGTNKDGDTVSIELNADGPEKTKGRIEVGRR